MLTHSSSLCHLRLGKTPTFHVHLEQEMRRYEASGNPGRNVDVLDFWKQNQDVFPLLAKMARIVLAIPASSAKSERVFSTGGLIVTPRRFAHEYIGMMIFVYNQ